MPRLFENGMGVTLELVAYRIGSCFKGGAPRAQAQREGLAAVKCVRIYYCMYSLWERLAKRERGKLKVSESRSRI